MSYLQKNKFSGRGRGVLRSKSIFIIAVFLILFLLSYFFPSGMRSLFFSVSKPFWTASSQVGRSFSLTFEFFRSKENLVKENTELKDSLAGLKLHQTDYDTLLQENEMLKSQLGRSEQKSKVMSAVLSKPPRSAYDTFIIDLGSKDGINVGDKVYFSDSMIAGFVSSVASSDSIVTLYSNSGQKSEAVLQRTNTMFEIIGQGGSNFSLEAPKDTDIVWGDVFLFPGISQSILGSVYYIDNASQSSFKTVYIRAPESIFQTKFVFVEKSSN